MLITRKRSGVYRLGSTFTYEQFVQEAIDQHFVGLGFEEDPHYEPDADLACFHKDNSESWCIESKGLTKAPKIDFEALLGQLLMRMKDPSRMYGAGLPNVPVYVGHMKTIPDRVRQ